MIFFKKIDTYLFYILLYNENLKHPEIPSHINKKDISKCFICNQKNDIIEDITSLTKQNIVINVDQTNDITIIDNNNNEL